MASNTLLTIGMVTRELLMHLKGNLAFTRGVSRQWESQFAVTGAKIGAPLQIRKTPKYAVQSGAPFTAQNYIEEYVTLIVNQQKHVDVEFTSVEATLSLDDWSRRIGRPAASRLAAEIDKDGLLCYSQVANSVVSPTAAAEKFYWYNVAHAILMQEGAPQDGDFTVCLEPMEQAAVVNANKGLFQSAEQIRQGYEKGTMGEMAGATWVMDQNVAAHTTGARGGAAIVTTAGQTGSAILTSTWTASGLRLKAGDVIQFTGVYAVNPQTLQSTGRLRDFVVTSNVTADAGGLATVNISPPIILAPDPRATVSNAAAASAPILYTGAANTTYAQNLYYHKNAFTCAIVPMVMPESGSASRASDDEFRVSLRLWKDSVIATDTHPSRLDALYGWLCQEPSLCCRVWSVPGVT